MNRWTLKGFQDIARGTFENSGQNIYVSRKGNLQRIWRFDVNNDGYVDLLVANSHDYNEHPKLYIISDPTGEAKLQEVLTQGAQMAATGDINGDGYDDLVITVTHDGQHADMPSYVYFGGKDGITENRKVDLAAPAGTCCGIGDFNGDGKLELAYSIASSADCASASQLFDHRLRVYRQEDNGFRMNAFNDYPMKLTYFEVADVDGDGCDDLYCRTAEGEWFVLWGGKEGFSLENKTVVGEPTDDYKRFDLLPGGGGNVSYKEFARPRVIALNGKKYLFYADAEKARFIHFSGRTPDGDEIVLPVPNVISAASGHIRGDAADDLVLLQYNGLEQQRALVYFGSEGYGVPVKELPVRTPRDVLLCDFSGNGCDDIVIAQGRSMTAHTTESLLYPVAEGGVIADEPRRFTTHNCVRALAGDFNGSGKKSLVFVNQQQSNAYGHIPVYVYLNSPEGFKPENRLEFPGHSAGSMLPVDFNDDGWPDILILQNAEDQPFLKPTADLYWGSPEGFDLNRMQSFPAPLAWGGHCADIDKDGYLDVITCSGRSVRVFKGTAEGYSEANMYEIDVLDGAPEGTAAGALWPALADLNGDGWLDLVVPVSWQPYSLIYWGGPEGYSNERCTKLPVDDGLTVRVADLNKDGYPDLVFGSRASYYRNTYQEGSVTIFWGGPEGYSGYNCCVLPSYQSNCITIQDLNNDGWLDIFASSYFNKRERDINSFIYWNDHGNFSLTNRKRMFTHSSSAAWAGDFNEDGYVDLFITNHRAYGSHRTESAIWWNGPEGFDEKNRTWLPTIGPHDMVANDMGNVMTRGPEEYYITPAGSVDGLCKVGWKGEIPWKTWVNCQIRTADTEEGLKDAAFVGRDGTADTRFDCGEAIPAELVKGKFFQIKLYLGAVNSGNSPRIQEIYAEGCGGDIWRSIPRSAKGGRSAAFRISRWSPRSCGNWWTWQGFMPREGTCSPSATPSCRSSPW